MKHVMVDLETMGTSAGCAIVSIGAVMFDPETDTLGAEFYRNVDLQSCVSLGLTIDASTVLWWLQQSDKARAALRTNPQHLTAALAAYRTWLPADARVWSHGASFDHTVLAAAYAAVGVTTPWKFRNERDTRTIFDLSGVSLLAHATGTPHNALDDAKTQAMAVIQAYKILGVK